MTLCADWRSTGEDRYWRGEEAELKRSTTGPLGRTPFMLPADMDLAVWDLRWEQRFPLITSTTYDLATTTLRHCYQNVHPADHQGGICCCQGAALGRL